MGLSTTSPPSGGNGPSTGESNQTIASSGDAFEFDTGSYDIGTAVIDDDCTVTLADPPAVKTFQASFNGDGVADHTVTLPGGHSVVVRQDAVDYRVICQTKNIGATWAYQNIGTPSVNRAGLLHFSLPFAYTDAVALKAGMTIFTPEAGDVLMDGWLEVDPAFDGTTPLADVGCFAEADDYGVLAYVGPSMWDLTKRTFEDLHGYTMYGDHTLASMHDFRHATDQAAPGRILPIRFTGEHPVQLIATQDGYKSGLQIDSTVGAGVVHLLVLRT